MIISVPDHFVLIRLLNVGEIRRDNDIRFSQTHHGTIFLRVRFERGIVHLEKYYTQTVHINFLKQSQSMPD